MLIITPIFAFGIVSGLLISKPIMLVVAAILVLLAVILYKKSQIVFYSVVAWLFANIIVLVHHDYDYKPLKNIHYKTRISGEIVDIEDDSYKPRIIINITKNSEELSDIKRVRLNISEQQYNTLNIYDKIDADIFLAPPEKALFDGAYDFSFYAKNNQLQATGRLSFLHNIKPYKQFSLSRQAHIIRKEINRLLLSHLSSETASPALSMMTGTRFYIPDAISEEWRESGIYHLLSISGLHMTIMASIIFFLITSFLALIPWLTFGALRKKWAAFLSIPICFGYVLLSGGGAPIIRAYIMVSVCLCAVILDKRIITLRTACCAFIIILILKPHDIFNIGFMLSFVSVLGIIIGVNLIEKIKQKTGKQSVLLNFIIINLCAGYAGVVLTIFTFGTHSTYGFLTNMIAIPLASFLIMPAILLTMLSSPFEIALYPIVALGFGVDILNQCASWIANLPYAVQYVQAPLIFLVMIYYFGFYCLVLNQFYIARLGVVCIVLSMLGFFLTPKKDYLEIKKQQTIYYINQNKQLIALKPESADFARENKFHKEQILAYFGYAKNYEIKENLPNYNKKYTTINNNKFYFKND